jgi:hypothetical protein
LLFLVRSYHDVQHAHFQLKSPGHFSFVSKVIKIWTRWGNTKYPLSWSIIQEYNFTWPFLAFLNSLLFLVRSYHDVQHAHFQLKSYFTIEHGKIIGIFYVIFWLHYTSVLPSFQAYGAYSGGMYTDATSALGQMYPGMHYKNKLQNNCHFFQIINFQWQLHGKHYRPELIIQIDRS